MSSKKEIRQENIEEQIREKRRAARRDERGVDMEERINQGFKIIQSITVANSEFVLGENMKCPGKFVTWQCRDGTDYFWGHYISGRLYAVKDLYERALLETDNLIYRMELFRLMTGLWQGFMSA